MLLLIDACARAESRTLPLAEKAAEILTADTGVYTTLHLYDEKDLKPLDRDALFLRDSRIENHDYTDNSFRFAKQFRDADEIIIAAPYWDLSFPAVLKCYIESICVNGLTFYYTETGEPKGLCRAKRLIYITTAGGFIPENNYGYNYMKQLCMDYFGIKNTICVKAEGLDIYGANIPEILASAELDLKIKLK